jgi:hypothetical protein
MKMKADREIVLLKEMSARLDSNSLSTPEVGRFIAGRGSIEEHVTKVCGAWIKPGARDMTEFQKVLIETTKRKGREARAREKSLMLELEMLDKLRRGWLIVFNTLTIRPGCYELVFEGKARVWRDYIRSLDRAVGKAMFGSVKEFEASKEEVHTYLAVKELGDRTDRGHIHAIHCFRHMPDPWKDPNIGCRNGTNREITELKKYWKWGFSSPIAVRFGHLDPFGQLGWKWPNVVEDGKIKPFPAKPPAAVARYMTDYLNKTLADQEELKWKTRSKVKLGMGPIEIAVLACKTETLRRHLCRVTSSAYLPKVSGRPLPMKKVREAALREYLSRMEMKSPNSHLWNSLKALEPQKTIVERVRLMTEKDSLSYRAFQSITSSETVTLRNADISDARECFQLVLQELEAGARVGGAGPAHAG